MYCQWKAVTLADCSAVIFCFCLSKKIISSDNATGVELASCIIPDYISSIPFDPSSVGAKFVSISDYDTKYSVIQDPQGRITVGAVGEITPNISVTR